MLNVTIMRSGYSSLILEISKVPIPDPVPPPIEWHTWKPVGGSTALRLAFCFFANHVQHGVDELCAFGVMSFGPVVSGAGLAKHEIVWPEDLAVGARANAVHGPGLQIHEHSSRKESLQQNVMAVNFVRANL